MHQPIPLTSISSAITVSLRLSNICHHVQALEKFKNPSAMHQSPRCLVYWILQILLRKNMNPGCAPEAVRSVDKFREIWARMGRLRWGVVSDLIFSLNHPSMRGSGREIPSARYTRSSSVEYVSLSEQNIKIQAIVFDLKQEVSSWRRQAWNPLDTRYTGVKYL